jgi:fructose/tagatose bisphosphate aldolase
MTSIESARALFARTRKERFALGAFNVDNQETLIGIARAAAVRRSPLLIEASHGEVEAMGLRNLRAMVDNYRDEYGIEIVHQSGPLPERGGGEGRYRRRVRVHPYRREPGAQERH